MRITARLRDSMLVVLMFFGSASLCVFALADGTPWFARVLSLAGAAMMAGALTFVLDAEDFGT